MIQNNEIKEIISQENPNINDMINVIVRYIFDLKNEEIDRNIINIPNNNYQISICYHLFSIAKKHYEKTN